MNPTDLRGILAYIPRFRERTFVFSLDGEIVAHENFQNLLLDIAVLRSLNIKVVLVHGAAHQTRAIASERGVVLTNADGTGVTDEDTLAASVSAANQVTHEIVAGLASLDLRAAVTNAVTAHPFGIVGGVDHLATGKVERVDTGYLEKLFDAQAIPVVSPIGFDGEGHTYRCNSDQVAVAIATALGSAKLLFIGPHAGLCRNDRLITGIPVAEAEELLQQNAKSLPPDLRSKAEYAVRACRGGVSRSHILDGRADECILAEIFSNEGVGTMIHINEYAEIRPAQKKDVRPLFALIRQGMDSAELVRRTQAQISEKLADYYVYEIDRNVVGCVAVHPFPATGQAELACLTVAAGHENQGIGARLVAFADKVARERDITELFALSTQTFNYFTQKGGFAEGSPEALPIERRKQYEASQRKSKVLVKKL